MRFACRLRGLRSLLLLLLRLGSLRNQIFAKGDLRERNPMEPRVIQDLLRSWACIRICVEQRRNQVDSSSWQRVVNLWGQLIISTSDLWVKLLVSCTSVREASRQDCKQKDTQSPNICWRTTVLCFVYDFWCHVRRSATEDFDFLLVRDARTETKVDDLDIQVVVKQEVFKFDVTMSYASIMTVANTFDNLLENTFSLFLFQSPIRLGF